MAAITSTHDPVRFVLDEARLLNDGRYRDWIALFAQDGHYWVPLAGDRQSDPVEYASIAYEDRLLLATRAERLQSKRAHSLEPGVRSLHVLQQPSVEMEPPVNPAADCKVYTPFLYVEVRGGRQTMLAGTWRHQLRRTPLGLRIVLKRVDLLNASAAHEVIQLFP